MSRSFRHRFIVLSLSIYVLLSVMLGRLRCIHGAAWILQQSGRGVRRQDKQHFGRVGRQPIIPATYHHQTGRPSSCWKSARGFHQSALTALRAKWKLGEEVSVRIDDESFVDGVVEEIRGGGWYNIKLSNSNSQQCDKVIKCRGTQLRQSATTVSSEDTVMMFTAPNKTRPVIITEDLEVTEETFGNNMPYSAPTIHDLDAMIKGQSLKTGQSNERDHDFLEQIAHHSKYENWVCFTDLHCSPSSLETCLEVLNEVHDVAVQNNAGVLFLGDFWHHRGTLRVDCLNAILEHFRNWKVPMIMIPGNHDQVTLGGTMHGLTPIENAYRVGDVPGPLVLSYTTKFRDALFVPHIRDIPTMESILQSDTAKTASALFVHADVKGALMNDMIVSTDGIPPSSFPPEKLIYSGHFHKPHTVKSAHNVKIEYLGSPYQTSLAEAQQPKALAILDSKWQCVEYYPINIGRRHFKVESWRDLLNLHPAPQDFGSDGSADAVKMGDRIVVTVTKEEVRTIQPAINVHIQHLRDSGIMVEIRERKVVVDPLGNTDSDITDTLDELTPESTWRAYLENEVTREAITTDERRMVLQDKGFEILNELEESNAVMSIESGTMSELRLNNVTLTGFGPFEESAFYPLWNRGLVLLKGVNNDGGSDSNGSGKSSLAMAALWAFTGSLDPRKAADSKVADIVNDASKAAEVTVEGTVNGEAFSVTRTKTASKGALFFRLDEEDLTAQSIKETQVMIEERLGINARLLSRTMFHGQHAMNELLETTDAHFKDELSLVVPLSLWQDAARLARAKSRATGKRVSELCGMISMRSEDMEKLCIRLTRAGEVLNEKQSILKAMEVELAEDRNESNVLGGGIKDRDNMENRLESVLESVRCLEEKYDSLIAQRDADILPLQRSLKELIDSISTLTDRCSKEERQVFATSLKLDTAKTGLSRLEEKWSVDLSNGIEDLSIVPETCPTCLQPVNAEGKGHSHEDLQNIARAELVDAHQEVQTAGHELQDLSSRLEACNQSLVARQTMKAEMEADIDRESSRWNEELREIENDLISSRHKMAELVQISQMATKRETVQSSLDTAKNTVEIAAGMYNEIERELEDGKDRLAKLQADMDEEQQNERTLSEVAELFGQRGVQAFVLQAAVEALEATTQSYLDDLSDGAQRLRLSLDAGDRITRTAFVSGADGDYKERPLAALSGGQWRKCSLALTLGFAELLARKGKLRPSVCVLDEPLQHLDRYGRSKVGEVIRSILRPAGAEGLNGFGGLGLSTVIVILQDCQSEELNEAFDCIDEVVKTNSKSTVKIDELA